MARKARTDLEVSYKWNGKNEPERLNRVFDMLFDKVIKKLNENGEPKQTKSSKI